MKKLLGLLFFLLLTSPALAQLGPTKGTSFRSGDGLLGTPAYSFTAHTGHGMWYNAGYLSFSASGTQTLAMNGSQFYHRGAITNLDSGASVFANAVELPIGAAATPPLTFTSHSGDGVFWSTSYGGGVGIAVGGTQQAYFVNSTFISPPLVASITGHTEFTTSSHFQYGFQLHQRTDSNASFTIEQDGNNFGSDVIVWCSNAAARTVTLRTATTYKPGAIVLLVDSAGTAGGANISVARSSSDTINGGTGNVAVVTTNFAHSTCTTDGVSAWICSINN